MVTKLELEQSLAKEKAASLKMKKALKDSESQLAKFIDYLTHVKAERDGFVKALNNLIQQNAREDLESIQKRFPVVARERQRLISERNDAIQQSADMRVAIVTERDNAVDKLQRRIDELESAYQQISPEHEELQRKNDDLSIQNAHLESQIKQLRESANKSHQEAVQLSRKLHQLKQNLDTASLNGRVRAERIDKAIEACDQYLFVEFGITKDVDRKNLSQVQRFVFYVRDVLSKA